mmetsp:Transcript_105352/g.328392  ORF Transcript_105352/g.328392 Transcript_105352/m.328392 type:complete len:438 (-) Transcript_105352:273-1586(-)
MVAPRRGLVVDLEAALPVGEVLLAHAALHRQSEAHGEHEQRGQDVCGPAHPARPRAGNQLGEERRAPRRQILPPALLRVDVEAVGVAPMSVALKVVRLAEVQIEGGVDLANERSGVGHEPGRAVDARDDARVSAVPRVDAVPLGDGPCARVPLCISGGLSARPRLEVVALDVPTEGRMLGLWPLQYVAHMVHAGNSVADRRGEARAAEGVEQVQHVDEYSPGGVDVTVFLSMRRASRLLEEHHHEHRHGNLQDQRYEVGGPVLLARPRHADSAGRFGHGEVEVLRARRRGARASVGAADDQRGSLVQERVDGHQRVLHVGPPQQVEQVVDVQEAAAAGVQALPQVGKNAVVEVEVPEKVPELPLANGHLTVDVDCEPSAPDLLEAEAGGPGVGRPLALRPGRGPLEERMRAQGGTPSAATGELKSARARRPGQTMRA